MEISEHCYRRAKERAGLNKNSFSKMVNKAIEKNISLDKTKNGLNKWICSTTLKHQYKLSVLVYDKYLLLHSNYNFASIYQVPRNLLPISKFINIS